MSKWISIKEAADKYGVTTSDIRSWAKLRDIARSSIGKDFVVDDESIQEYLNRNRVPASDEYLRTLEKLYENQTVVNDVNLEIIQMQQSDLQSQRKKSSLMEEMLELFEEQNQCLLDSLEHISMHSPSLFRDLKDWVGRLRKKIRG